MEELFKHLKNEDIKLLAAKHLGIYLTDGSARTLMVNRDYELLTEIEGRNVVGRYMQNLQDEGYFDRSVTLLVLKKKAPVTIEQKLLRTDKKVIVTGNPIFNQDGDIIFVATVVCSLDQGAAALQEAEGNRTPLIVISHVIATSKMMQSVLVRALRVAALDATVLILGETGVGKEVVASAIHQFSTRKDKPFIKINMTTIPEELFESELFGYRAGSFTGALKTGKIGLVQAANGGTLFMDEIGEVSLKNQVKLLRLLEKKEIRPIGSLSSSRLDVRFIAATNRDLPSLVREGLFREDLYFRLNVVPICIPPLRERPEDIYGLATFFLGKFADYYKTEKCLTPSAIEPLTDYAWPGNVRELYNLMERVAVIYPNKKITKENVLEELALKLPAAMIVKPQLSLLNDDFQTALDNFEKDLIEQALKNHGSNLQQAAQSLRMHRTTLLRKLRKFKMMAH